jgi:hypothetical protein
MIRTYVALILAAAALAAPSAASATTFCVPTFHPACTDTGTNVAEADLQTALTTDGKDGVADRVIIAAGTFTRADSWELDGSDTDNLEIAGAGRSLTELTTSEPANAYRVDLYGQRAVSMHDLTITIPASVPDHQGAGLIGYSGTFQRVDIESRNDRSDGVNLSGGGSFRDGWVHGAQGGTIASGLDTAPTYTGSVEVERSVFDDTSWAVWSHSPNVTLFARRVRINDPLAIGFYVSFGAFGVFENGVIHASGHAHAVQARAENAGTVIATVRHTTIVGEALDPGTPAVYAEVLDIPGIGPINLVMRDSIVTGYQTGLWRKAPTSATVGDASLTALYSHLPFAKHEEGDGQTSIANSIDGASSDPLFVAAGDYHLKPGSPAIDHADPQTSGQVTEDFDGLLRPVDGDGDGDARRDMGAFEYHVPTPDPQPQQPADPGTPSDPGTAPVQPGQLAADITAPRISKLRFGRVSARRGGRISLTLSEDATVVLRFRPLHGRGKTLKLTVKGKAGLNRVRIKARKLEPRRYRVTVSATDGAGNHSLTVTRRVRIRG